MTQSFDAVAHCKTLFFLDILINQHTDLFLEELCLFEILLFVSNVLSMLKLLSLVMVSGRLGLVLNLSPFLLLC